MKTWKFFIFAAMARLLLGSPIPRTAFADEAASAPDLVQTQAPLIEKIEQTMEASEFRDGLLLLDQLREITVARNAEPKIQSTAEIDFIRRDFAQGMKFTGDRLTQAQAQQAARQNGRAFLERGNSAQAIAQYRESLALAERLYGEDAYQAMLAKVGLTRSVLQTDDGHDDALKMMKAVCATLKDRGLAESRIHRLAAVGVMELLIRQNATADAIAQATMTAQLFEEARLDHTQDYVYVTTALATLLNRESRYEESLRRLRGAIHNIRGITVRSAPFHLRLFELYVETKESLGDYDKVPEAYEMMLEIINQIPDYPADLRLKTLENYLVVLKQLGRTQRLQEIESEIAETKSNPRLQKSRYSE